MFISIIVPVYNTRRYLDECVQSLLCQDIDAEDYQIIFVDDGSTDDSYILLQEYEKEYPAITIVRQNNSGVCTARNNGLSIAVGDYIWFIDSDDYIQENILGSLRHVAYTGNYDRVIFGNLFFVDEGGKKIDRNIENMKANTLWKDSVVTRSIFKRDFLLKNNLKFHYPELTYGEDAIYMYELKRACPNTYEIEKAIYFVRGRACSASSEQNTPEGNRKKLVSTLREAQIMQEYYEGGDDSQMTADRLMSFLWGTIYRIAGLSVKDANIYMQKLKKCGLFPYKRPANCTIKKSFQTNREDIVGKVFDTIYLNLHKHWGYYAMRCWFQIFQLKRKLNGA